MPFLSYFVAKKNNEVIVPPVVNHKWSIVVTIGDEVRTYNFADGPCTNRAWRSMIELFDDGDIDSAVMSEIETGLILKKL